MCTQNTNWSEVQQRINMRLFSQRQNFSVFPARRKSRRFNNTVEHMGNLLHDQRKDDFYEFDRQAIHARCIGFYATHGINYFPVLHLPERETVGRVGR